MFRGVLWLLLLVAWLLPFSLSAQAVLTPRATRAAAAVARDTDGLGRLYAEVNNLIHTPWSDGEERRWYYDRVGGVLDGAPRLVAPALVTAMLARYTAVGWLVAQSAPRDPPALVFRRPAQPHDSE